MNKKTKIYDECGIPVYTIYKWTNLENNMFYFGKTQRHPEVRKQEHIDDMLNLNRAYTYLHHAMRSYTLKNFKFEIIFQCKTLENLNWAETYFITEYNSIDKNIGYNLTTGGESSLMSEQTRLKMSESKKGDKNSMFGKTHTDEAKEKQSIAAKIFFAEYGNPRSGKTNSPEHQKMLADLARTRTGEKHPLYGKHHTDETRKITMTFKTEESLNELKALYKNGITQVALSKMFNTTTKTVNLAINNKGAYKKK